MLLPVDMRDWLPDNHLVWFVLDAVDELDVNVLEQRRRIGGAGTCGYDPRMLIALLIYAYCQGTRSSRQIERMCVTDVAFRVLCAQDVPDHATIARFRASAQDAFRDLFGQVLMVAARAGLGNFGTVAIDGTKIRANASIDANRGKDWFEQQAQAVIEDAVKIDQLEDARASTESVNQQCDRVPAELADRTRRRDRIRQAAQELDAQTQRRARVEEDRQRAAAARRQRSEDGQPVVGRIPGRAAPLGRGPSSSRSRDRDASGQARPIREAVVRKTEADGSATAADGAVRSHRTGSSSRGQRRGRSRTRRNGP